MFYKHIQKRLFITNYSSPTNPKVFIQVSKDNKTLGRMVFELYHNKNPKTANNFLSLCKGDSKEGLTYKGSPFHRVIPGFMAQGGDITDGNGTGGMSIYGRNFPDDNMSVKHYKKHMLSMANSGKNTNGSQFFITFIPCDWLDGNHTVFGEMVEGADVVSAMEKLGSPSGATRSTLKVEDCGEIASENKEGGKNESESAPNKFL